MISLFSRGKSLEKMANWPEDFSDQKRLIGSQTQTGVDNRQVDKDFHARRNNPRDENVSLTLLSRIFPCESPSTCNSLSSRLASCNFSSSSCSNSWTLRCSSSGFSCLTVSATNCEDSFINHRKRRRQLISRTCSANPACVVLKLTVLTNERHSGGKRLSMERLNRNRRKWSFQSINLSPRRTSLRTPCTT